MIYELVTLGALLALYALYALTHVVFKAKRRAKHKDDIHVFLDLETLSVKPDGAIMVIAANAVDYLGRTVDSLEVKIRRASAEAYGYADPATLKWWGEQSEAAQREAFISGPRLDTHEALLQLTGFFEVLPAANPLVWGNAPTLDCTLLRNAYEAVGLEVPWRFYQERDCRTIADLSNYKATAVFEGTPHVALDDAKHQAKYTIKTLRKVLGY